jgi:hypothetical protein
MDLSSMHSAVRGYVRDGVQTDPKSRAERGAVRAWRRRLPQDPGEIRRVVPTAPANAWLFGPEP